MRPISIKNVPCEEAEIRDFMKIRNPLNHMSVCFRKSLIEDLGGYPKLYLNEDYGLWAKAMVNGATLRNLPNILVLARAGPNMHARRGGWKYILSELRLQNFLVHLGIKSRSKATLDGFLRSAVFSAPVSLRGLIYTHLLRT
jgi:hypothetical protein